MNKAGMHIKVNDPQSPWWSYNAVIIEECKDGTFLVEFPGGRRRYLSSMQFGFIPAKPVYNLDGSPA